MCWKYCRLWDKDEFLTVNEVELHQTDDQDFIVDNDFEESVKDMA